jgi:hypothetical protein
LRQVAPLQFPRIRQFLQSEGGLPVANIIKSLLRPFRFKIPFLVDIVFISDPEQIRKIEASGAVDRLHAYGTKALPFWIKTFFSATRFCDYERDLWFLSLESDHKPEIAKRRASLKTEIDKGYSPTDVQSIADLIKAKADDETLAYAITQVVNRRFFDRDVPTQITRAAQHTLQRLGETILPWKYLRARASQKKIMAYCERTLGGNAHLVDIGHNIGETVQTTSVALRILSANLDKPVEEIFTRHALTTKVPRIATKSTRFDGLLLFPTVPGKTVLILQIEKAAAKSSDILFTFGTGRNERACVFKDFFLHFMKDLQEALRDETPNTTAHV